MAWPAWFTVADEAKANALVMSFTNKAWDHRNVCPVCRTKQPCPDLTKMIDAVHLATREIGDVAFAVYLEALERRYGHENYRLP